MAKRRLFSLAAILMATLFLSVAGALSAIGGVSQTPAANAVPGTGSVAVIWSQDTLCNSGEVQYWVNDFTHSHAVTLTAAAAVTGAGPYTWTATIPTQSSGDVIEYQLHNFGTCPDEIDNNAVRYYGYGQGPSSTSTYHAIHLNHDLSDWRANEILGASGTITYYTTWDATYLYVAFSGGISDTARLNIAIDTDPGTNNLPGSSATDVLAAADFAGYLTPEYIVQSTGITSLDVYTRSGTSWGTAASIYAGGANLSRSGAVAEIRIPRSSVGLSTTSDPFGLYLWVTDSAGFMFGVFGPDNSTLTTRQRTETVWNSSGSGLSPSDDAKFDHNNSETRTLGITALRNLYVSNGTATLNAANTTLTNATIASGATLQGNGSVTLTVGGNWLNQGTFTPVSSGVVFSSTTDQSITGTSTTNFYDLILNDGLMGYWKFDEGSGTTALDSSGHNYDGVLTGGPTYTRTTSSVIAFSDPYAVALGLTNWVNMGDLQAFMHLGDFTIAQWVRLDALGGPPNDWASPISKGEFAGPGWTVLFNRDTITANHLINLYINGTAVATISAPSGGWVVGQWYHYAFARSGSALKGYLNGVEQTSVTDATIPNTNTASVAIGNTSTDRYHWEGSIDETRIYNRGLSATEVQALGTGHLPNTSWNTLTLGAPVSVTHSLRLNSGTFDVSAANYPVTLQGDLERNGGIFNARSSNVAFSGSGVQNLTTDAFTFNNVTVGTGVTLTTIADVTVGGALSNSGATRETRSISGTSGIRFGLANIIITPTVSGSLSSLDVIRRDVNHPNASGTPDNGVGWGRYWTITPNTGANNTFSATLTLPQANLVQPRACKYLGGPSWDCDDGTHTTSTSSTVTRSGIAAFSDWAIGGQSGFADLTISKAVSLSSAVPGQPISYTLAFSNAGTATATSVVITDIVPSSITVQSVSNSGAIITDTGLRPGYVWQVQNLAPGAGGVITVSGMISPALTGLPATVTNTATITGTAVESVTGNNSSSASTAVVRANTTTTLASAPNPSTFGQSVTFTATVSVNPPGSGTPSGSVTFYDNGTPLGTSPLNNGVATTSTASLSTGTHPITATYSGNASFNPSNGTLPGGQVVFDTPISLSVSNSSPTTLGQVTYFTATATGTNITYVWNFGDGIVTGSSPQSSISHTYGLSGTYTARITATNSLSQVVATTPVTITNLAPIANAGSNQSVLVSSLVTLDGSVSSDPDGHLPLTYRWAQVGGPSVVLSGATLSRTTFTAPSVPAVLTFTLTVTDARGLAGVPAQVVVTVNDQPVSGLSVINSSPTTLGQATYFTATATGTNITYVWNFGDGIVTGSGPQTSISHTYGLSGTYTARITATNSLSQVVATTPVTITNLAPIANAGGNQSVLVSSLVTLDGSASSDPDGHLPLTYRWIQTGGSSVVLSGATLSRTTFTAPSVPAVLTFTLTVTDARGLAGVPAQVVVNVNDQPVSGLSVINSSPTTLGQATYFTATAIGSNITYTWNFGDGSSVVNGPESIISHTYPAIGSYTAIITASNTTGVITTTSPVTITTPLYHTYLPLVQQNSGGANDLVGQLQFAASDHDQPSQPQSETSFSIAMSAIIDNITHELANAMATILATPR